MKSTGFLKCAGAVLILTVYCCSANRLPETESNSGIQTRRRVTSLDVSIPINNILEKLDILIKSGLDLDLMISSLLTILTSCLPSAATTPTPFVLPNDTRRAIEVEIQNFFLNQQTSLFQNDPISDYCKSEDFREIHNFLWVDDIQFRDMIQFMHDFGYPNIYETIKGMYTQNGCPEDLIETIRPIPVSIKKGATQYKPSFIRNQIISSAKKDNSLQLPFQSECNILQILMDLLKAGTLELLSLLETVIDEIMTDPSMHFLVGKIQEPIKGPSFRNFRLLTPVRKLFIVLHQLIVSNESIKGLLELVGSLLGLDLININLLETISNLIEILLWGNFELVPPFP